ncbi:MAG: hypothetical protein Q7T57_05670, partial [Dehalococcoidales bacterium]|nr:hypothetical protein [Dehalococcoidales bacterium]
MFSIVVTPPDESAPSHSSSSSAAAAAIVESESAAVAELRAMGVSARMIDIAVRHNEAKDASNNNGSGQTAVHTSRPAAEVDAITTNSLDVKAVHSLAPFSTATAASSSAASLSSSSVRIPSSLFPRSLFLSRDGCLLPPVANPDLTPSLTRADSFWVGEEEERRQRG